MTQTPLNPDDFTNKIMYMGCEGGALYTAERDRKFYVIINDCMIADSLSEEDAKDFADYLQPNWQVFNSAQERYAYLLERYGPSNWNWHIVTAMMAVPVPDLTGLSDSATNQLTRRHVAELHRMAQEGDIAGIEKFNTSRTRNNYIIVDDYRRALLDAAAEDRRILEGVGFRKVGEWRLEKDEPSYRVSHHYESANILYAFIHQGELVYLGKTDQPLEKHLWDFTYKGSKQGELIRMALLGRNPVEIYALPDNGLLWFGGFMVNLADGLYDSMVSDLRPAWN